MFRRLPLPSLSAGLLVAATGVGAGDLVISALSGARFGYTLLWAIAAGALLKYALNEGLARWELATGTTLLAGWVNRMPRFIPLYFGAYLCFWAFLVSGTLIAYTGVVANSVFPLPVSPAAGTAIWGAGQSLLCACLVRYGGFRYVEACMKVAIAVMFLVVIGCAAWTAPNVTEVLRHALLPGLPAGKDGLLFATALIGGVGGTLTIMCYAYWLRERRSIGAVSLAEVRIDLGVAYFLTALFGMAITVIAAGVRPEAVGGYGLVTGIADRLAVLMGPIGYWTFLLGFWAAVFTSMLGVWSGVPYLFADLVQRYRHRYGNGAPPADRLGEQAAYRWFLLYLAVPPILLTVYQRPSWIGVAYAVAGAAFMPFLATVLLFQNNRERWVGKLRNGPATNAALVVCLLLFLVLLAVEVL